MFTSLRCKAQCGYPLYSEYEHTHINQLLYYHLHDNNLRKKTWAPVAWIHDSALYDIGNSWGVHNLKFQRFGYSMEQQAFSMCHWLHFLGYRWFIHMLDAVGGLHVHTLFTECGYVINGTHPLFIASVKHLLEYIYWIYHPLMHTGYVTVLGRPRSAIGEHSHSVLMYDVLV